MTSAVSSTPSFSSSPAQHFPGGRRPSRAIPPTAPILTHEAALDSIRNFLKERSSYDVFPVSFRLIVLDHQLVVKKALEAMILNGVVSAPLWNSQTSKFAGMFTVSDVIHLIQYYYHTSSWEGAAEDVHAFRLENIREIERTLKVPPPPLLSVHPLKPLFEACKLLIQTHARRLPLIDKDGQTGGEVVLSVLTQYRVLKAISMNCKETICLTSSVRSLSIGTYVSSPPDSTPLSPDAGKLAYIKSAENPFYPLATATLQTTVFDVVHMFSELGISAVPIVDDQGRVINLYETVDVITLVRLGAYHSLDLTIAQALKRRSPDFPGVVTCHPGDSLGSLFALIKMRRIHRLVVVEGDENGAERKGRLVGIISLSDMLRHVIGSNVEIGGGGVGAVPVQTVLDNEVKAEKEALAAEAEAGGQPLVGSPAQQ